jgi:hypothetical protein
MGAEPFRPSGGGIGAEPFRPSGGGIGAEPFAATMAPLLCAITTVFRPIAPVKTNIARSSAVSLCDMSASQGSTTPETLYTY